MSTLSEIDRSAPVDEPVVDRGAGRVERLRDWRRGAEFPSRAVVAFGSLLTVVFWNLPAFAPNQPSGDYDYGLAIALARQFGLSFGDEVATTYGPLYFLAIPSVIHRGEVFVAYLLWFLFSVACTAAIHQALRRHVGTRVAWLVVGAMAASSSIVPLTVVITTTFALVLTLSIFYAREELPPWAERAYPVAMGALVAAMLLTKFSVGLMCGPVVLGAVLARHKPLRPLLEYAISGVVGLVGLWIIAGQPPFQVAEYVVRALSVGSGHAQAMGMEQPDRAWEYVIAVPLVLVVVVGLVTTGAGRRRWALYAGVALGSWLLLKQGFVRHDGHSVQFFSVAVGFAAVLAVLKRSSVLASAAVVALLAQAMSFGGGLSTIDPARSLRTFGEGVMVVASDSQRTRIVENARAALKQNTALPQSLIDRIGDGSVRTAPFDFAMSWTYGLKTTILPTLLDYGAYTRLLDEMNEQWVVDDRTAPDFIVRDDGRIALDGRFPLWDSPRTNLAQACRYDWVATEGRWNLLRRTENRCGEERVLGEATVDRFQSVPVPQSPDGIVIARVYPEESWFDKAKSLAFRSGELWLTVDGEQHRLPLSHQDAPLLLSSPGDRSLVLAGKELTAHQFTMNMPGRVVFSVVPTR